MILDEEAQHCRKMKNAIWLFLYLVLTADRKTGLLTRKVKTISADMGVSRDTTLRWLTILKREKYIDAKSTGRCLAIRIKKWRPLGEVAKLPEEKWDISNFRSGNDPTSEVRENSGISAKIKENFARTASPIENTIKRALLKNDIEDKKFLTSNTFQDFHPRTRVELLALDLAEGLGDMEGLGLYLSYARKYPESLLRGLLGAIKEIPDVKIKKSRGALFNHLIQKYETQTSHHFGN